MNLHDFIKTSLIDIVTAVKEAKSENACIAPALNKPDGNTTLLRTSGGHHPAFLIDFDIAVTAETSSSNTASASVNWIQVLSGGVNSKSSDTNESVSRVKFTVPVTFGF